MSSLNWRARCVVGRASMGIGALLLSAGLAAAQPVPPRVPAAPGGIPGLPSVQVRTLEVRDITLGTPDQGQVTIARIAFKGIARGNDLVRAETVEFEGVAGRFGPRRIEIPMVTVSDFEVPADLFRALSEGGNPTLDWVAVLEKSSFSELQIGIATEDYAAGPPIKLHYNQIVLKSLRGGILASGRTGALTAHADPNQPPLLQIGELTQEKINIAEFARFATSAGGGGPKQLVEKATLNDITMNVDDSVVTVRAIELFGIDGRAPEKAGAARPAAGSPLVPPGIGRIVQPGQGGGGSGERNAAGYARDVLAHLRISNYSFHGIRVNAPGAKTAVSIEGISLNGWSGRALELLDVTGVEVEGPDVKVKLERFALERFSYGALLDYALAGLAQGQVPDLSLAKITELTPRMSAMRFGRLEVETPAGPFAISEFRAEVDDPDTALPELTTLALGRLSVDLSKAKTNPGVAKLKGYGYEKLAGDLNLMLRARQKEQTLSLDNTSILIDRVGRVDFGVRLGSVDIPGLQKDPDGVDRIMENARVEQVTLGLTNLGVAERIIAELAQAMPPSPQPIRARLAAEIKAQAQAMFGPALAPGSLEAIESFILSPGRLIARAEPKAGSPPLTIGGMQGMPPPALLSNVTIRIEVPKN